MGDDLRTLIGNAPVMLWSCPMPSHGTWTLGQTARQTVRWEGNVAHCCEPGCGRTSADPPSHRLIRPCLTHAHEVNEWARAGMHNHGLGLADECPDCLTTDPVSGEWVTCLSIAAPH